MSAYWEPRAEASAASTVPTHTPLKGDARKLEIDQYVKPVTFINKQNNKFVRINKSQIWSTNYPSVTPTIARCNAAPEPTACF